LSSETVSIESLHLENNFFSSNSNAFSILSSSGSVSTPSIFKVIGNRINSNYNFPFVLGSGSSVGGVWASVEWKSNYWTQPSPDALVVFSYSSFNITGSIEADVIKLGGQCKFIGDVLDVRKFTLFGGHFDLALETSSAVLYPFTEASGTIEVSSSTELYFSPDKDNNAIQLLDFNASTFGIKWQLPDVPDTATSYNFVQPSPSTLTFFDYEGNNEYDITVSFNPTINLTSFKFGAVTCSSSCPTGRTASTCTSRYKCSCVDPWAGFECEYDKTGQPSGVRCNVTGPTGISTEDVVIDSALSIPSLHELATTENVILSSQLILPSKNSMIARGRFDMNYASVTNIFASLKEDSTSGSCTIVSDAFVEAESVTSEDTSVVNVTLDLSQLTTSGNCHPSASSVKALITAANGATLSDGQVWIVNFVGRSSYSGLFFNFPLLRGHDGSDGIPSSIAIHSEDACVSVSANVGDISFSAYCEPPTTPSSTSSASPSSEVPSSPPSSTGSSQNTPPPAGSPTGTSSLLQPALSFTIALFFIAVFA
jgi:hypothetical protein